jgi:hypothetical protein
MMGDGHQRAQAQLQTGASDVMDPWLTTGEVLSLKSWAWLVGHIAPSAHSGRMSDRLLTPPAILSESHAPFAR